MAYIPGLHFLNAMSILMDNNYIRSHRVTERFKNLSDNDFLAATVLILTCRRKMKWLFNFRSSDDKKSEIPHNLPHTVEEKLPPLRTQSIQCLVSRSTGVGSFKKNSVFF